MTHAIFGVLGMSGGELLLVLASFILIGGLLLVGSAVAAYLVIRSLRRGEDPLAPPPQADAGGLQGQLVYEHAQITGSQFRDVNLSGSEFSNVNLSGTRLHDVNLSNVIINAAQMGGAVFRHIGPPPGPQGEQDRQRPVRFEDVMLCDSTFSKVDLSNVRVSECDLSGMTIDGVLVSEALSAYRRQQAIRPGDPLPGLSES